MTSNESFDFVSFMQEQGIDFSEHDKDFNDLDVLAEHLASSSRADEQFRLNAWHTNVNIPAGSEPGTVAMGRQGGAAVVDPYGNVYAWRVEVRSDQSLLDEDRVGLLLIVNGQPAFMTIRALSALMLRIDQYIATGQSDVDDDGWAF